MSTIFLKKVALARNEERITTVEEDRKDGKTTVFTDRQRYKE